MSRYVRVRGRGDRYKRHSIHVTLRQRPRAMVMPVQDAGATS